MSRSSVWQLSDGVVRCNLRVFMPTLLVVKMFNLLKRLIVIGGTGVGGYAGY
jgi:hypothetical protein